MYRKLKLYGASIDHLGESMQLLANRDAQDTSNLNTQDMERMFEVKEYITTDLSKTPNLDEICSEFGLIRSKLIRDFKAGFGRPVYQFFNHVRMEEARGMLLEKDVVTEVSQSLGLKDYPNFQMLSRNFMVCHHQ